MRYIPTVLLLPAAESAAASSNAGSSTAPASSTAAFQTPAGIEQQQRLKGRNKAIKLPTSLEGALARVPAIAHLGKYVRAANAVAAATAEEYPEVPTAMRAALAFCTCCLSLHSFGGRKRYDKIFLPFHCLCSEKVTNSTTLTGTACVL